MFREAMKGRGEVNERSILELSASSQEATVDGIFQQIGSDSDAAAQRTLHYLTNNGRAESLIASARKHVFLKGHDSHDYKFSSAALEDFYQISPRWRNHYLASSVFKLLGAKSADNGLVERIRAVLA